MATWVGLERSALAEYQQYGKAITRPESIYWPEGVPLFPEPDPDSPLAASLAMIWHDVQAVARQELGRELNSNEVSAVIDAVRKASDWHFYLGECIQACQDYGVLDLTASE